MYEKQVPLGQKRIKNCQKRRPLKRSDTFRNLIVFSISLLILQLKFSDPYKRIFKSFSLE